ncbi:GapA-binding peptide SR1P [Bacillus weihaiensis]|uniref:Phosphoesterase n=1 Tax=Bacillus weihaiensis TaxID=1547283 RepID=A0A1L3MST6_9BACI|nr:GapA-binding peptide SR1P [Bacillus weihaiensis]APH05405.1 phosphoesterase [Bacillus weihaiensis]
MGTIICQHCNSTIGHIEGEKVTTLYGQCNHHNCGDQKQSRVSVKVK